MKVTYKKLWKLLIDKEMKKTDSITVVGINPNILARLGKDEYVSMESLHKICKAFDCDIGDKIPENLLTEDETLLNYYDIATSKV